MSEVTAIRPLSQGQTITGPLFSEPMRVETVQAAGPGTWTAGLVGTRSERYRRVTLSANDLRQVRVFEARNSFDGDGRLLRLGLQAHALGIAYEFDPYFGLSVSRVDPLPHQLEAVYEHLLKLARVRFLLADDAGAGLSEEIVRAVIEHPQQRWEVRRGRDVLQSKVTMGDPAKEYVVRVFVDVDRDPNEVVTAYRSGNVDKYWRQEP
jgi:hypothetical protein